MHNVERGIYVACRRRRPVLVDAAVQLFASALCMLPSLQGSDHHHPFYVVYASTCYADTPLTRLDSTLDDTQVHTHTHTHTHTYIHIPPINHHHPTKPRSRFSVIRSARSFVRFSRSGRPAPSRPRGHLRWTRTGTCPHRVHHRNTASVTVPTTRRQGEEDLRGAPRGHPEGDAITMLCPCTTAPRQVARRAGPFVAGGVCLYVGG